ncbi:hypothetical protein GGX14DRAFT_602589 [Mycena pura]|uniref:Uncharacterized protein n=1 Tax=Mycena pura TaxID=153505 RepID=A0AAD6YFL7_9AGAR|nr:hypothetical protein GGX14DRAFT_602589 [Mycena pura]
MNGGKLAVVRDHHNPRASFVGAALVKYTVQTPFNVPIPFDLVQTPWVESPMESQTNLSAGSYGLMNSFANSDPARSISSLAEMLDMRCSSATTESASVYLLVSNARSLGGDLAEEDAGSRRSSWRTGAQARWARRNRLTSWWGRRRARRWGIRTERYVSEFWCNFAAFCVYSCLTAGGSLPHCALWRAPLLPSPTFASGLSLEVSAGPMSSSRSSDGPPVDDSDWYDPEESERDLPHPKYWSLEDQEVIVGIKQREAPISLSTLCGTYRWFYEFPDPGTTDPVDVVYPESSSKAQAPGHLTITCPAGKKPTLKNITGTVVHFGKEARFAGIRRAKDRDKQLVDNHWEFVSFKWKADYGDNQDDGNSLFALAVDDDSGEPFVMFRYASPGRVGDTYLDIAAKKERRRRGASGCSLSSAEMARLGMDASYPEVRATALAAEAAGTESSDGSEPQSSSEEESESPTETRSTGKRKISDDERQSRSKKRKST